MIVVKSSLFLKHPSGTFNVYVYNTLTGSPLQGASVTFFYPGGSTEKLTDYQGFASFTHNDVSSIRARKSGYAEQTQETPTKDIDDPTPFPPEAFNYTFSLSPLAPPPPTYCDLTVAVTGGGRANPPAGHYPSTYLVGSDLWVNAYPDSGWRYELMRRNGVEWTRDNPGGFLNLADREAIEVVFVSVPTPPPPVLPTINPAVAAAAAVTVTALAVVFARAMEWI